MFNSNRHQSTMQTWPTWYHGLPLKAEHLLGLEDYLLWRTRITDQSGHGIKEFNWKDSLETSPGEGNIKIRVRGILQGLTPAGQPVVLCKSDTLDATLKLDGADERESRATNREVGRETSFDLSIEIAPDNSIEIAPDNLKQRMILQVRKSEQVRKNAASPSGDLSGHGEIEVARQAPSNWLYIGRYQYRADQPLELVHRPFVLCLASMQPLDASWQGWTELFASRIASLLQTQEEKANPVNVREFVLLSEITRLAFHWSSTPLPQLAEQLRYVSWLRSRRGDSPSLGKVSSLADSTFPPAGAQSHDVPVLLAALLDTRISKTLPELLRELQGAIHYHVPLLAFKQWSEQLADLEHGSMLNQVADVLRQRMLERDREFDGWSRAIGLLTMIRLRHDWPVDIGKRYSQKPSWLKRQGTEMTLESAAARDLDELFKGDAQHAPAGPLGFYCLARVAGTLPLVVNSVGAPLQRYFQLLAKIPSAIVTNKRSDRVVEYLWHSRQPPQAYRNAMSPGPGLVYPRIAPTLAKNAEQNIRVAVIGADGSGKTALLRSCLEMFKGNSISNVRSRITFPDNAQLVTRVEGAEEINGELDLDEANFKLQILKDSWQRLAQQNQSWDLIIIAIEVAALDVVSAFRPVELLQELAGAARFMLRTNPAAMITIAYTKADELGLMSDDRLRVIGLQHHVETLTRLATTGSSDWEKTWESFVALIGASGGTEAWKTTVQFILKQSRELWEGIMRNEQRTCPAMNAYFVAADPLDDYTKPLHRRGLLELFVDFCEYYRKMRIPG